MSILLETTTAGSNPSRRAARLAKAHAYLLKHFRRVPTFRELAAVAELSPYHFHRLYRRTYGKTAKRVMFELQVAEVQRLIVAGAPLDRAAKSAGFAHQSHMCSRFKQIVGTTPGRWAHEARQTPA